MSGRCYIHTFEPLCLLGIHSQPHSWLDLASVDHHIWPYSLPNSLYISPDWPQKKGCFYKHCPNPLCSGTRTSGSALSISPPHPCLLVISAEIWGGFPLQEQVSHPEEPPGSRQQLGRGYRMGGGCVHLPCGHRDVTLAFDHAFPSRARQERFVHWPPVLIAGLPK